LWKANISRHLPVLRFFACPASPSSRGLFQWFSKNYGELKVLNPTFPFLLRTTENAMPAITTQIHFTADDVLDYMIQNNKFTSSAQLDAALSFKTFDFEKMNEERWKSPNFDPEKPFFEEETPNWRSKFPERAQDLKVYLEMKEELAELENIIKGGEENVYEKAKSDLLMCQRVDLWGSGEQEVEMALRHLVKLGERFNWRNDKKEKAEYISIFYPGASDF